MPEPETNKPDNGSASPQHESPQAGAAESSGPSPSAAADELKVAPPEPTKTSDLPTGPGGQPAVWHVSRGGKEPEGPLSIDELKGQAASGRLSARDVVWKEGMPDWVPAGSIRELGFSQGVRTSPPPQPGRAAAADPGAMQQLDETLSRPTFFSFAGLACGAVAVVLVLLCPNKGFDWFVGAGLFFLIFIVCQAVSAVLRALNRLQASQQATDPTE